MNDPTLPALNADPTSDARLSRRALLRAAAGLAGALALGLESSPVSADASAPFALAFWDGARLTDPTQMHADPALRGASVTLTLRSLPAGAAPTLQALTAHFPDTDAPNPVWTPFTAWAASPEDGARGIAFTMPVHPAWGLLLTVDLGASGGQSVCRLDSGGGRGTSKLRAGTYLIAPAGTDWRGVAPTDGGYLMQGGGPVGFDYLALTVAPA